MNRILLFLLLGVACLAGCKKDQSAQEKINAQLAVDHKIIVNYLTENKLIDQAKQVDSAGVETGIYYIANDPGSGTDLFTSATTITVGYQATLMSTGATIAKTDTVYPSYVLGQTLRGWQLGIPKHVQKGGTITLYLPSHYAYGPFAQPTLGLPANAILIFKITVYNITN